MAQPQIPLFRPAYIIFLVQLLLQVCLGVVAFVLPHGTTSRGQGKHKIMPSFYRVYVAPHGALIFIITVVPKEHHLEGPLLQQQLQQPRRGKRYDLLPLNAGGKGFGKNLNKGGDGGGEKNKSKQEGGASSASSQVRGCFFFWVRKSIDAYKNFMQKTPSMADCFKGLLCNMLLYKNMTHYDTLPTLHTN